MTEKTNREDVVLEVVGGVEIRLSGACNKELSLGEEHNDGKEGISGGKKRIRLVASHTMSISPIEVLDGPSALAVSYQRHIICSPLPVGEGRGQTGNGRSEENKGNARVKNWTRKRFAESEEVCRTIGQLHSRCPITAASFGL